ncbi:hypothetical protein EXIGLDRAFT_718297 [Exidia glandulosa HHB12029]|uniref:N-acetyltransferase domain-containing protein n=1 Tax=Exidia glandulosa HHB12029 TaxID=1314781 RepID=A0A165HVE6_EXIGL|nr:hypothetical protein EXIGLDRAFT_718297 [Exidia glandulosa HHB12029]
MAQLGRYSVVAGNPSPQRYHDLRKITGLTPPPSDLVAATRGLENTWYGVIVIDTHSDEANDVVGMGRLTGDGALFLFLSDVAVHPDHQGKGLAKLIMEKLIAHADEHAPAAYVALIGDPPAHERVYPKYGFVDCTPSVGMFRWSAPRAKELAEDPQSKWLG